MAVSELRALREKKGSLRDAEARTGISRGLLSKYERGLVSSPTYDKVVRLAEYLDVTPSHCIRLIEAARKQAANGRAP